MRLLMVSQYYPPETGAAQNRLHALARRLRAAGVDVRVLTAVPNYPSMRVRPGYRGRLLVRETIDGVPVLRCWLYVHRSRSLLPRLAGYLSFAASALVAGVVAGGPADVVFCESPPLFAGIAGLGLARLKRAPFVFNVSDLWPESARALGLVSNRAALALTRRLEELLYRQAVLVTAQTRGIRDDIAARTPRTEVVWLPNGVDADEPDDAPRGAWRAEHGLAADDFVVLYAGVLGHAQGLRVALDAAERLRTHPDVKVVLLGDGPERDELEADRAARRLDNVLLLDPVSRQEARHALADADAALVPLRRVPLFRGAVPSKLVEALGCGTPVLLGIEGEARRLFVDEGRCALPFVPEDPDDLARRVLELRADPALCHELGARGAELARRRFSNDAIAQELLDALERSTGAAPPPAGVASGGRGARRQPASR